MHFLATILQFALGILGMILVFCLAILVHEFGHFLAARLLGFKVDAFSIFFGPALWKRTSGGTEYRIGCIPLGGYVALPQLDPSSMNAIQGAHGKDADAKGAGDAGAAAEDTPPPPMAVWKRIVVAVAGPLGNIVLAVILAFAIFAFAPKDKFGGHGTTVGAVDPGSRAEAAGIRTGDQIVSVNGQPVSFWSEVQIECHLAGSTNAGLPVCVRRDGALVELTLPVVKDDDSDYLLLDGVAPRAGCAIVDVKPGSPAAEAGLVPGDIVVTIAGAEPAGPEDAAKRVAATAGRTFEIVVRRKGLTEPLALSLAARHDEAFDRQVIGAAFADPADQVPQWMTYRQPLRQLSGDAKSILRVLRALFAPKTKGESKRAAKDMGGIGILLYVLWLEMQNGIFHLMAFLRFLCVNLAILNLLPIPVLDGGHVLFAVIEMITRRRPSPKLVDIVTGFFAFLLIGLMALLLVRDAIRLGKLARRHQPAPTEQIEERPADDVEGAVTGEAAPARQPAAE